MRKILKTLLCALVGTTAFSFAGCAFFANSNEPHQHVYNIEEIIKEPNCGEKGEKKITCWQCGDSYTEEIETNPDYHKIENGECVYCGVKFSGGLQYALSNDDTYYIVSGIGSCADTNIVIPKTYRALPVKAIAPYAFADCESLNGITIPDSVTIVKSGAFTNCTSLTSITVPNSVTKIESDAFSGCTALENIQLSNGITAIDANTFEGCSILSEIEIPESVTSIGAYAFKGCTGLTSIGFPKGLKKIGNGAFEYCANLTELEIPDPVWEIGEKAFANCTKLESVKLPKQLMQIEEALFSECTSLTSIVIPDNITSMKDRVFENCSALTSVTMGKKVESIGEYVFECCESLTCLEIPNSVTSIGAYAFNACFELTTISLGSKVNEIGAYAFNSCSKLSNITVGADNQNYQSIDGNLYSNGGVTLLKYAIGKTDASFIIPQTVTSIAERAFEGSNYLKSVVIPDGVTGIGRSAFADCTKLVNIQIPDSVTSIAKDAFNRTGDYNNPNNWPDGVFYIGKHLITADYISGTYTVKDGTLFIADYAFSGCGNLMGLTIANSVTSIGECAFKDCERLTSITMPDGITSVGEKAFDNTGYYKTASNWSDNVLYMGKCLIEAKDTLSGAYTVKAGTLCIADSAFKDCAGLTSVVIAESVTRIGKYAFENCTALTDAIFETLEGWKVVQISISKTQISDTEDAAMYLRATYCAKNWRRE